MRIEFEDVVVAPPAMGDCNNDTIVITGVDGSSSKIVPGALCGTLSGQHIILNVKDQTPGAKITFNVDVSNSFTKWNMKVIQYACSDAELLAPAGCLTYETEKTGSITSFNNDGGNGELINNQMFSHCIKHQDGYCDVTLSEKDFSLGSGDSLTFGSNVVTGSSLSVTTWNFTGPYVIPAVSDADNAKMDSGYDIGYILLPC